ncbi:hypothetical protein HanXRQr2_Chr04g0151651 [Helianthus annuus]|uniref:C2HC zinc finger plants domain-containing protein n=1 Tax=Helianthus annuus TaxID=4232 RepID=A0A251UYD3_HELAN|nr:uncharacterized protein LOC110936128 [Helianthus annuus]KAF5808976.1 hypothetical protein HanXRQr2_Chr04g0151651 [Helianthus annuus]KAJ0580053.1 hypothetical protein HanHA300_Chr04g0124821 [Helianthus annuus]KAJ0587416.1 hypothetical protein HanIR_Chr04g0162921 [Helianthus annuus]KAJ0595967.1 hypothetical protein HanHA89_Chr04g0137351 [Helianthus annuus]
MDAQNDVDMMDTDAPPPPPPSSLPESSSLEVVRGLLTVARQLIDQGKPSEALQAVLTAMKAKGGEAAALQALNRAKELYRNKIHETTAADELASLFAEFAIAESLQAIPEPPSTSNNAPGPPSLEPDATGTSILAETGRKQVVLDAFSDGSSFICQQCGGLVSNDRKDEHYAFWCGTRS